MVRRFSHQSSAFARTALGALAALLLALAAPRVASAQARGTLVVLGLRAPDGDDEAANNVTLALRRAARAAGFQVPDTATPLESLIAQFNCPETLPASCLQQIAGEVHAEQMLYGAVRREGHGRTAPLRIEVGLFSGGSARMADPVQVARATAMDPEAMNTTSRHIIDALLPSPTAATPVTGGPTPVGPATPPHPVPIRRYIGIGVAALGAVGLALGIYNIANYYSTQSNENQPGHAWYDYQPVDGAGNFIAGGDQLCAANDAGQQNMNPAGNGAYTHAGVANVCGSTRDASTQAWIWGATGVALIGVGLVLIFTDNSDAQPRQASTRDPHVRNRASAMPWMVTPVLSPTVQGAAFHLTF
jgi:hypothetical protein